MSRSKTTVSGAKSYSEIGEFWDTHDLADFWEKTKEADFEVDIGSEVTYYALDRDLSAKIREVARKRGISAHTLINQWVAEKLHEQNKRPRVRA